MQKLPCINISEDGSHASKPTYLHDKKRKRCPNKWKNNKRKSYLSKGIIKPEALQKMMLNSMNAPHHILYVRTHAVSNATKRSKHNSNARYANPFMSLETGR